MKTSSILIKLILINTFLYIDLAMPLKVKNPTKPTKQKTSNQTPAAKPNHMFKKSTFSTVMRPLDSKLVTKAASSGCEPELLMQSQKE